MAGAMREKEAADHLIIGVDVGGTKIAAAGVDGQGNIRGRVHSPTDVSSPEITVRSIAEAIEAAIAASGSSPGGITAVGLGLPGKVDPERGIGILSVNLGWRDVPIKTMLEEDLGIPCFIENDVKVAALGESRYGAGKGVRNMVYLTIGTGIGAGVIIEGKIYRGSTGMAGEIGHAIVERSGPRCRCGTRGCLEAVAAGPAIAALATSAIQAGSETPLREVAKANKGGVTAEMVCQAAMQGDLVAREIFEEIGTYIGLGVHMLIMLYDPELVVLGGGVTEAGDLLLNPVRRELKRLATWSYVAKEMLKPEMVRLTALGTDVGILGAAALAEREVAHLSALV